MNPYAPDDALVAWLTRPAAYTRLALVQIHQSLAAGNAVYKQREGLLPPYWPHILYRKIHEATRQGAGGILRHSRDRFEIVAVVRSDKITVAPSTLLEPLALALQADLKLFSYLETPTGRTWRPRIQNHALAREFAATGTQGVTITELGLEAVFLSR